MKTILIQCLAVFVAATFVPASADPPSNAEIVSDDGRLQIFSLADGANLKRFASGDFIFRLARDKMTGVVYWARRGNPKNIVATVSDPDSIASPEAIHEALMTVAELPKICGRDIHKSKVVFIPEDFEVTPNSDQWELGPVFMEGEVESGRTGATPVKLLSIRDYRNKS